MTEAENANEIIVNPKSVVIHAGSRFMHAGFSGEDAPLSVIPSVVGRKRHNVPDGLLQKNVYFGEEAEKIRGVLLVKRPIESGGMVTNWDDFEQLIQHTYHEVLKVDPGEHALLLTEPPTNPVVNRERSTQMMFETFKIPCFYLAANSVMAALAAGMKTGIVFDSGDRVTHAVPVYEGHHIPLSCTHAFIGGDDVTGDLRVNGFEFLSNHPSDYDYIRQFKEQNCYVVQDMKNEKITEKRSFEFIDGKEFKLGEDLYKCTECLFNPKYEHDGIQHCLDVAIRKFRLVDDQPKDFLYKNILLTGGNTMFKGFKERLTKELNILTNHEFDIEINAPENCDKLPWLGGSMFADSANFFDEICVTKADYEEYGPHVVYKFCF